MPRNIIVGAIGVGTDLNPPRFRVIEPTTQKRAPFLAACNGYGNLQASIVASAIVQCPYWSGLDPNGSVTLPFLSDNSASTPVGNCQWEYDVDPGQPDNVQYIFTYWFDGTVQLTIASNSGTIFDSGLNGGGTGAFNYGDVLLNSITLANTGGCNASPLSPPSGYDGSATAVFA